MPSRWPLELLSTYMAGNPTGLNFLCLYRIPHDEFRVECDINHGESKLQTHTDTTDTSMMNSDLLLLAANVVMSHVLVCCVQ